MARVRLRCQHCRTPLEAPTVGAATLRLDAHLDECPAAHHITNPQNEETHPHE